MGSCRLCYKKNDLEKDAVACKGHKVDNKEGNPNTYEELFQPWDSQEDERVWIEATEVECDHYGHGLNDCHKQKQKWPDGYSDPRKLPQYIFLSEMFSLSLFSLYSLTFAKLLII